MPAINSFRNLPWSDLWRASAGLLRRLARWAGHLIIVAGAIATLLFVVQQTTPWKLAANITPSVARGFYLVHEGGTPALGDLVVVRYRAPAWTHAYSGLPAPGERLIKRVVAVPGDGMEVDGEWIRRCAPGGDCAPIARRVAQGTAGIYYPPLVLESPVPAGKLFLATDSPAGFDSRYLGYFDATDVIGVAYLLVPLWWEPSPSIAEGER